MIGDSSIDRLAYAVCQMGRSELIDRIKSFPAPFPMDFTDDYLSRLPEERLRHILLAAMIGLRPKDHGR